MGAGAVAAATCDASVLDAVVAAGCTTRSNAPLLARLRAPPSKKYLGFCLGGSREQVRSYLGCCPLPPPLPLCRRCRCRCTLQAGVLVHHVFWF